MTQLIVALDTENSLRHVVALRQVGVTFFKLSAEAMMEPSFFDILHLLGKIDADFFLDLKTYDTRDTVKRIARRAFELGARFLTVHATPSMLEAAMRAKPVGDYHKVLAVGKLTDDYDGRIDEYVPQAARADGIICPVRMVKYIRQSFSHPPITVCPAIRHFGEDRNNHNRPETPSEARNAGADFIVCGRPIYNAPDPIAAARAIIEELI